MLAGSMEACIVYEYEHEFWLNTDGSGRVNVTGRSDLWKAFKALESSKGAANTVDEATIQRLFVRSGLSVRRLHRSYRDGKAYLAVEAAFTDVNRVGGSPAFPDLALALRQEGDRLVFRGTWRTPPGADVDRIQSKEGLLAVRFHLPSKIYEHKNAIAGVQRGNIVEWRQDLSAAMAGRSLDIGVVMDQRSILSTTLFIFIGTVVAAAAFASVLLLVAFRIGRRGIMIQNAVASIKKDETDESMNDRDAAPPHGRKNKR
ncbi:MAG: hypothetical protein JXO72_03260 [Vicinamibacteria bacterium]|nr:hypothetical protein [Vicinamibacteria bacterium]